MKQEFITYQQALELKELGFDEPCFGYYYTLNGKDWKFADEKQYDSLDEFYNIGSKFTISAPLYQQAFRWFREKHDLVHRIDRDGGWWICTILNLYDEKEQGTIEIHIEQCYPDTYEEAEHACLIKLIEIVKNK